MGMTSSRMSAVKSPNSWSVRQKASDERGEESELVVGAAEGLGAVGADGDALSVACAFEGSDALDELLGLGGVVGFAEVLVGVDVDEDGGDVEGAGEGGVSEALRELGVGVEESAVEVVEGGVAVPEECACEGVEVFVAGGEPGAVEEFGLDELSPAAVAVGEVGVALELCLDEESDDAAEVEESGEGLWFGRLVVGLWEGVDEGAEGVGVPEGLLARLVGGDALGEVSGGEGVEDGGRRAESDGDGMGGVVDAGLEGVSGDAAGGVFALVVGVEGDGGGGVALEAEGGVGGPGEGGVGAGGVGAAVLEVDVGCEEGGLSGLRGAPECGGGAGADVGDGADALPEVEDASQPGGAKPCGEVSLRLAGPVPLLGEIVGLLRQIVGAFDEHWVNTGHGDESLLDRAPFRDDAFHTLM